MTDAVETAAAAAAAKVAATKEVGSPTQQEEETPAAASTEVLPETKLRTPEDDEDDDDDEDLFGGDDDEQESPTKREAPSVEKEEPSNPPPSPEAPAAVKASSISPETAETSFARPPIDPPARVEESAPSVQTTATPRTELLAIPRKSSSVSNASSSVALPNGSPIVKTVAAPASPQTGMYGLPAGVRIPDSVIRSHLLEAREGNQRLLETLKSLPVSLINDALTEFDDAVEIKGDAIRNHGAYLYGVVKRYCSVHERALSGEGTGILPMGEGLTPTIHARLDQLVSSGFCTEDEMNEKVKSKIRMLSEKDALFALDELSSVDRKSIRNFGSYFMGILNRYMRGDRTSKISSPSQREERQRGRDRFSHHRDSSSYPPKRDRSRDRFDPSYRRGSNEPYPSYSQQQQQQPIYDTRLQQQPWQNQPPPPPPQQQPYMGGPPPMNQPPPSMNQQQQQYRPPVDQQQQQGMMPSYQQQPPNQQQPPSMYQQPPSNPSFVQQGYPPQGMPQGSNAPGMYQQQQPMMGGVQQTYGSVGNSQQQLYMNSQQHSMMTNQQQPFVRNSAGPPMGNQPPGGSQQGWQPPQQQPAAPVDILGLADKAASAVQALAASQGNKPPPYPQQQQQQQQPQGYPPSYSSGMQQQPPPYQQQQQLLPPYQQPLQPYGSNQNRNVADRNPRHTKASMNDLPITVQYAIQNLIVTGAIDGPLDEGILGMIFDLPEQMALANLQKFPTLDRSTMRNKTAYLAGMLRRDLEKINKR